MKGLRHFFIAGLATILPLSLTILIFWFLVSKLGTLFNPLFRVLPFLSQLPNFVLTLLGFFLLLILIIVIGAVTSGLIGRWFLNIIEDFIVRLPIVRDVYSSARQLTNAVFVDRKSLKRVVAIEYPRKGLYTIGFLMNEEKLSSTQKDYYLIFMPTTPNPTSGWLILAPTDEVKELDLSIDEGMRLIVSGGIVLPPPIRNKLIL